MGNGSTGSPPSATDLRAFSDKPCLQNAHPLSAKSRKLIHQSLGSLGNIVSVPSCPVRPVRKMFVVRERTTPLFRLLKSHSTKTHQSEESFN